MKAWNKVQLAIILAFVAFGAYIFASPYFIKKSGVIVVSVSNPECQNVHIGDTITEVGGNQINDIQDFVSAKFQSKQFVSLVINSGPGGCIALSDGSIGIEVKTFVQSGIIFGTDLKGGTKYTINIGSLPASQLQNISRNLKTRTSYLNLPDAKVQIDDNNLEIIAGKDTNVNQLLFPGYLECNIEEGIILKDDTASLQIGSDNYTIKKIGENFLIDNITHAIGDTLYLADMKTTIVNKTNTSVIISLTAFNSSDISGEIAGYSQTSFDSNSGKYSFNTLVRLSSAASKRFNEITQNIKTVVIGNQISLDSVLVYKLDGEDLGRLGMPANLKGQNISTLYIIVSDASKESLLNKKNIVEASINAGSLPEGLSISGKRDVAATEEKNITPLLGVIIFLIGIIPLFFIMKYKKIKHNLLSILVGTAEIFSIVSLFIAFQVFYKLNFAFDFAALLGIVLLSFNWAANVISTNLHTHAQKELIIKIKYKKLVSVTGLIKILLVMFSFVSAAYGYQSASVIIFSGIFLDYFIYRPFYKNFIS